MKVPIRIASPARRPVHRSTGLTDDLHAAKFVSAGAINLQAVEDYDPL